MITYIENILDSLEKNENIINYLKTIYKEKTGEEPIIPEEDILKSQIIGDNEKELYPNQRYLTFKDKVNALNLPSSLDKNAKNRIEKLRRMKDTKVLIQKLDLSYFAEKDISVDLLRRVIDGLKLMKSVETINLSHNNMNDMFLDCICEFFFIPNLNKIDLSFNNFSRNCTKKLIATIKAAKALQYLDLSYNPFNHDEYSCLQLSNAVKGCEKLIHFGLCDVSRDAALRVITTRPGVKSLNLEDSRYKKKSFESIARYVSNKKYQLNVLSLKYVTIDFVYGAQYLAGGLKLNKSLISLNLYSTGICDVSGSLLIKALQNNKTLKDLDIGENRLSTQFCQMFSQVLKVNKVLEKVNLTKNYRIVNENYKFILEGLIENQTIKSLGDLMDTKVGVKFREITEKLLDLNEKMSNTQEGDLLKSQKTEFYKLSKGFEGLRKEEDSKELSNDLNEEERNEKEMIEKYKIVFNDDESYITQEIWNNEIF